MLGVSSINRNDTDAEYEWRTSELESKNYGETSSLADMIVKDRGK